MKLRSILFATLVVGSNVHADERIINYFHVDAVNVNKIYTSQTRELTDNYKAVVAYAINTNTTWKDDTVGVFLVSENGVYVLDIFSSERQKDFTPRIRAITPEELVVGVYSDYGELKRIKYVIDIDTEVKLVSRTELEPEGIPADLP